jgi:hypothetical protein
MILIKLFFKRIILIIEIFWEIILNLKFNKIYNSIISNKNDLIIHFHFLKIKKIDR